MSRTTNNSRKTMDSSKDKESAVPEDNQQMVDGDQVTTNMDVDGNSHHKYHQSIHNPFPHNSQIGEESGEFGHSSLSGREVSPSLNAKEGVSAFHLGDGGGPEQSLSTSLGFPDTGCTKDQVERMFDEFILPAMDKLKQLDNIGVNLFKKRAVGKVTKMYEHLDEATQEELNDMVSSCNKLYVQLHGYIGQQNQVSSSSSSNEISPSGNNSGTSSLSASSSTYAAAASIGFGPPRYGGPPPYGGMQGGYGMYGGYGVGGSELSIINPLNFKSTYTDGKFPEVTKTKFSVYPYPPHDRQSVAINKFYDKVLNIPEILKNASIKSKLINLFVAAAEGVNQQLIASSLEAFMVSMSDVCGGLSPDEAGLRDFTDHYGINPAASTSTDNNALSHLIDNVYGASTPFGPEPRKASAEVESVLDSLKQPFNHPGVCHERVNPEFKLLQYYLTDDLAIKCARRRFFSLTLNGLFRWCLENATSADSKSSSSRNVPVLSQQVYSKLSIYKMGFEKVFPATSAASSTSPRFRDKVSELSVLCANACPGLNYGLNVLDHFIYSMKDNTNLTFLSDLISVLGYMCQLDYTKPLADQLVRNLTVAKKYRMTKAWGGYSTSLFGLPCDADNQLELLSDNNVAKNFCALLYLGLGKAVPAVATSYLTKDIYEEIMVMEQGAHTMLHPIVQKIDENLGTQCFNAKATEIPDNFKATGIYALGAFNGGGAALNQPKKAAVNKTPKATAAAAAGNHVPQSIVNNYPLVRKCCTQSKNPSECIFAMAKAIEELAGVELFAHAGGNEKAKFQTPLVLINSESAWNKIRLPHNCYSANNADVKGALKLFAYLLTGRCESDKGIRYSFPADIVTLSRKCQSSNLSAKAKEAFSKRS